MAEGGGDRGALAGFTDRVSYNSENVGQAADRQGVHVVWDGDGALVFTGQSAKTRTRLRQHLNGDRGASVLHKQVGEFLDRQLGREASKQEIRGWLEECDVAWKYDSKPAALKAIIIDEFNPRFNTVVPSAGTVRSPKLTPPTDVEVTMSEAELIRQTLDSLVDEYRASGVSSEFASRDAWLENSDTITAALERLSTSGDLGQFSRSLADLPNPPSWFKQGAHRTFVGTIADRAESPEAASAAADVFSPPGDDVDAARKISRLVELAEGVERLYPGPGFAPLAASAMWAFVDPDHWPWLNPDAESALHILRLLPRYLDGAERYHSFRHLILTASAPPTDLLAALGRAAHEGSRSLSASVYARMQANSSLLASWYQSESYPSEEMADQASRNIEATLGEFDLFAKGMNDVLADRLVRDLVTSKTDPRVGYELHFPSRADGYAIFTIERNMALPSVRVWATPSGLAIGAHYGQRKYDDAMAVAQDLVADLPPGMEFFEVRPHRSGDRLRPAGREPLRGELFVGRWFEGGLTGTEVGEKTIESAVDLQPVFDRMVRAVGELPGTAEGEHDEFATLYEEFIASTGYPTEADRTDKAEREEMAKVISEDGLLAFDLHEFRRIYNTGRYGSPGPQSILNASLSQMSPEELDLFASNLEFLLRGLPPLADRVDALMPEGDRGVKGFGEAVITKLLAIEYPERILPIYVYRGPKGKGRMLNLLDMRDPQLDTAATGDRLIRSNDLLRDRLSPLFGEDLLGMSKFLYWLSERKETAEESEDETDHIGNLADSVLIDREVLDEMVELLRDKGQIIFYGPPGTGKTYLARELAKALAPDPAQRMLIQFHPSTSYEDFFEGYRPETDAQGRLTYRLVKGPLALITDRAKANPTKQHVLVIDEINRAHLPKVFGELLFLLEYRDESVRSLYRPDEPFELAKNLWVIGTMNTADRSIALVDAAMRRRFHFIPFFPDEGPMADLLRRWLDANSEPDWIADLLDMVNEELRDRLGGPHLQVGPSHFMRPDLSEEVLKQVWTYSVFPFVEEQLYGDQAAINEYHFDRVLKRFQSSIAPVDDLEEEGDDDTSAPGVE
jgi:5-methylcytosine-specific restriction protein B